MKTVAIILLIALAFSIAQPPAVAAPRPNILVIYTDDQPYKTVGCYPESPRWVATPHIDKLAAAGVRFHRAYLGSWCMPSRASLLTGKLPHAVESMRMAGTYPGSTYDPAKCPFFPALLRQGGYHTAQIGKWHTGTDTGFGRDWDYQIVWNRPGHPDNAGAYYDEQLLGFNGHDRRVGGYSTDNYTRWACEYIRGEQRDRAKPWFLWLCYSAVHGPTTPAPRHVGRYAGQNVPVPADIFGPRPGKPAYLEVTQAWEPNAAGRPVMKSRMQHPGNYDVSLAGLDFQKWVQQINECALAVDEGVGQLRVALEETGQLANTLVVFTSDQGFALGEHGCSAKLLPYDANLASPLIVSRPGTIPKGKVCRQAVSSVDLTATLCQAAEIDVKWKVHGRDISPLLRDPETADWKTPMLMEHTGKLYGADTRSIPADERLTDPAGVPWWVMLRDGRHKYIRTLVSGEPEEIYDLDSDPEELHNLAADTANRALLESLRAKTVAELKRTDAGFVDTLPAPRGN
ncbi:MAG: sulfatase-like hydrolase/transferase [Planctomycetaceae bacterium]